MLKSNKGFTLIELVLVIVILAILAAVAVPRFVDLRTEARKASGRGVGGAIGGNILMKHSAYIMWATDYSSKTVAEELDVSGDIAVTGAVGTNASATMVATVAGNTFGWFYTARSGLAAARITEITGF